MRNYLKYGLILLAVFAIGFSIYYWVQQAQEHSEMDHKKEFYTCSMHPEIIRDKPGNCPICGMTLVKKVTENQAEYSYQEEEYTCPMPEDSIFSASPGKCPKCGMNLMKTISKKILKEEKTLKYLLESTDYFIVGNFHTTTAIDTTITTKINLPGIVAYNPNSAVNIAARAGGRIEKMYVNYKYQRVTKGQKMFDLYSPELLTEQQNFIYLIANDLENGSIINASKQKLMLYGMSQNQINTLVKTKSVHPTITIYSPASGLVVGTDAMNESTKEMASANSNTEKLSIKEGSYVKKGETVFKLLNTSEVWGVFNVIQGVNSLLKTNQAITITSELDKSNSHQAKINFIETQLNPSDKTNSVRVYLNNAVLKWPIGLRLQGEVQLQSASGLWLHNEAMVSLGTTKVVFVKNGNGFKATAIQTGVTMGDYVQVLQGLTIQDAIAKNAQYLMDSESFIKTEKQ